MRTAALLALVSPVADRFYETDAISFLERKNQSYLSETLFLFQQLVRAFQKSFRATNRCATRRMRSGFLTIVGEVFRIFIF
jgi:hypothetical protein